ncbi:hypothetical protein [Roseimaritima sediminicola]|uniref:hypothetical protein n=1 Tax=Roseimaritima sediminicola TaxID=2662066 RepID=UPI0012984D14|nr:hypothetical protein [Roseimaritima sediminicola]
MIVFTCQQCGTRLQAYDENVGKKARCVCGEVMRVPEVSETEQPIPAAFDPAPYQPTDPHPTDSLPTTTEEMAEQAQEGMNFGSMAWGFILMIISAIWFVAALANGRTSGSAAVLFFIGLFRVISSFQGES